ncbi:MAG: hypothetical protein HFI86_05765 [Bacilli bacterium]|nr:hypothetical protein [Bacilli bacterium]
MNKLFDDKTYIDKSVITPYDKKKWKEKFQEYCDSDEIRKESDLTGLNACGYWYACDYCDGSDLPCACANAMLDYFNITGRKVDFKNTDKKYLDKLLREDFNE